MSSIEEFEYKGYTVEIDYDYDPLIPYEDSDMETETIFHPKAFTAGNAERYNHDQWLRAISKAKRDSEVMLDIYMYEHGGQTIAPLPEAYRFPDWRWDVAYIGVIVARREMLRNNYGWQRISKQRKEYVIDKIIKQDIKTIDDYLTGNIYCYVIKDENDEVVDSCGNYYGDDGTEAAKRDAMELIDSYEEKP